LLDIKKNGVFAMITSQRDPWAYQLLGEQNFQGQRGIWKFFLWWYRLTSPREVENPTLKQRDLARRSKILSALALFLGLTLMFVAYVALTGPNKQLINTVYILYGTLFICLILNRLGHVYSAGALLVVSIVGGMYFTVIMTALHGGVTPNDKDIFYLPFLGELVAAALLPTSMIFLIAAANTIISLYLLYNAPHTAAFAQMLATGSSSITFRIVEIHFFTALVLSIMATWTLIAIKRADRASELARLEHDFNAAANEKIKENERLARAVSEIIAVHMQVANGNLEARVPLKTDEQNVLWQIAVPLNNLLARYQQATRAAQQGDVCLSVLNRLTQEQPGLQEKALRYFSELRLPQQRDALSIHTPHQS
jgi:hypothetical protein